MVNNTLIVSTLHDNSGFALPLPFPVLMYGVSYSAAWVAANGFLDFSGHSSTGANTALPTTTGVRLYALWDALSVDNATACEVYEGGCGLFSAHVNDTFVIEVRAVETTGAMPYPHHYQLVFTKGSKDFQIVYGPQQVPTSFVTVGVESGRLATEWVFDGNVIDHHPLPGLSLLFKYDCPAFASAPSSGSPIADPDALWDSDIATKGTVQLATIIGASGLVTVALAVIIATWFVIRRRKKIRPVSDTEQPRRHQQQQQQTRGRTSSSSFSSSSSSSSSKEAPPPQKPLRHAKSNTAWAEKSAPKHARSRSEPAMAGRKR